MPPRMSSSSSSACSGIRRPTFSSSSTAQIARNQVASSRFQRVGLLRVARGTRRSPRRPARRRRRPSAPGSGRRAAGTGRRTPGSSTAKPAPRRRRRRSLIGSSKCIASRTAASVSCATGRTRRGSVGEHLLRRCPGSLELGPPLAERPRSASMRWSARIVLQSTQPSSPVRQVASIRSTSSGEKRRCSAKIGQISGRPGSPRRTFCGSVMNERTFARIASGLVADPDGVVERLRHLASVGARDQRRSRTAAAAARRARRRRAG